MKTMLLLALCCVALAAEKPALHLVSFTQLNEIRNKANHELTISTDEYIYKMQFPTADQAGSVPVDPDVSSTYELKIDPNQGQFASAENQLEGLKQMFAGVPDTTAEVADPTPTKAHRAGKQHHHAKQHHAKQHHEKKQRHGDGKVSAAVEVHQEEQLEVQPTETPTMTLDTPLYADGGEHSITDSIKQLLDVEMGMVNSDDSATAEPSQQNQFLQLSQSKGQKNYKYVAVEATPARELPAAYLRASRRPTSFIMAIQEKQKTSNEPRIETYHGHADDIEW